VSEMQLPLALPSCRTPPFWIWTSPAIKLKPPPDRRRSRLLMIEYLDQLKRVDSPGRKVAVLKVDVHEHPHESHAHESVDEWLQLLTLAMNPHQGPHGPH